MTHKTVQIGALAAMLCSTLPPQSRLRKENLRILYGKKCEISNIILGAMRNEVLAALVASAREKLLASLRIGERSTGMGLEKALLQQVFVLKHQREDRQTVQQV